MADSRLPAPGPPAAALDSADTVPDPHGAVLDPATIAELRRAQAEYGNPSFIQQLVAIYRANAPARVEQIRRAIAERDSATLTLVAHTLKSNCSMLGALSMAQACAALEDFGERAAFTDPSDAVVSGDLAALVATLDKELPRVLAALDALLQNG